MKDPISEAYNRLWTARIHDKQTYGTVEENEKIRELIYCGAYKDAVKMLGRIKGGRGYGKKKREEMIALIRPLYAPRIVKVHLGSIYTLPDGRSSIAEGIEKFRAEHPECEQFYGDMRRDKTPCKTVYRLYVYDPKTKINTYKYIFIERI